MRNKTRLPSLFFIFPIRLTPGALVYNTFTFGNVLKISPCRPLSQTVGSSMHGSREYCILCAHLHSF